MSAVPDAIIKSWNYQKGFVTANKEPKQNLVADPYQTSRSFIVREHRRQKTQNLDWGTQSHEITIPQSYAIISSCFLEITLPALNAGSYHPHPGMRAIQNLELFCDGEKVFSVPYYEVMCEYVSSLPDRCAKQFLQDFMGRTHNGVASGASRVLICPLFLPNSHYLRREDGKHRNYGCFPNQLNETSKLRFRVTMSPAGAVTANGADDAGSISDTTQFVSTILRSDEQTQRRFQSGNGVYSIQCPQFFEESGWTTVTANTPHDFSLLPRGCVTDLIVYSRPQTAHENDIVERSEENKIEKLTLTCDSQKVIEMTKPEQRLMKFQQDVRDNLYVSNEARICFSNNAASNDKVNMGSFSFRNVAKCTLQVTASEDAQVKVISKRMSKVFIRSDGKVVSSYE